MNMNSEEFTRSGTWSDTLDVALDKVMKDSPMVESKTRILPTKSLPQPSLRAKRQTRQNIMFSLTMQKRWDNNNELQSGMQFLNKAHIVGYSKPCNKFASWQRSERDGEQLHSLFTIKSHCDADYKYHEQDWTNISLLSMTMEEVKVKSEPIRTTLISKKDILQIPLPQRKNINNKF